MLSCMDAVSSAGAHASKPPTRSDIECAERELLSRGGPCNPDVLRATVKGRTFVVKDFAPRGFLVRTLLGPWLTLRETRAWRALQGCPGVPRFLGRVDALALAVEYRPGHCPRECSKEQARAFLDRLETAMREMHARGVVHLDLRHHSNLMVEKHTGEPVLIDFGAALVFRPGGLAARLLLPVLAVVDRGALSKWRGALACGENRKAA